MQKAPAHHLLRRLEEEDDEDEDSSESEDEEEEESDEEERVVSAIRAKNRAHEKALFYQRTYAEGQEELRTGKARPPQDAEEARMRVEEDQKGLYVEEIRSRLGDRIQEVMAEPATTTSPKPIGDMFGFGTGTGAQMWTRPMDELLTNYRFRSWNYQNSPKVYALSKAGTLVDSQSLIEANYCYPVIARQNLRVYKPLNPRGNMVPVYVMPPKDSLLPTDYGRGFAVGYRVNAGTGMVYFAVYKLPLRYPFQHEITKYASNFYQIPEICCWFRKYGVSDVDMNNNTVTMLDANGDRHTWKIEEMWALSRKDPEFYAKSAALSDIVKDYPGQLRPIFSTGNLFLSARLKKELDQENNSSQEETTTTTDDSSSANTATAAAGSSVVKPQIGAPTNAVAGVPVVAAPAAASINDSKPRRLIDLMPQLHHAAYGNQADDGTVGGALPPPGKLTYSLPSSGSKFGAGLPGAPSESSGQRV